MTRNDSRPRPDRESMKAAIRGQSPKMESYRLMRVYVENELAGEPVAKVSTLQDEIDAIFRAAIDDADLHGKTIEVRVYDEHGEDCLDVQTIAAHDWSPLDLTSGKRQTCKTCGVERSPLVVGR
jgi:hypothetical protein